VTWGRGMVRIFTFSRLAFVSVGVCTALILFLNGGGTVVSSSSPARVIHLSTGRDDGDHGARLASSVSGIAFVQSAVQNMNGAASSTTVTLPATVTEGDALVLEVGSDPASTVPVVSGVSGGGVTWTKGAAGGTSATGDDELWFGKDSTGGSGTRAVTVTMSAGNDDVGAYLAEFSGVAATMALDAHATKSGTGTVVSTPTLTTSQAGDLVVFAANTYQMITASPPSPWTDVKGPYTPLGSSYFNPVAYQTNVPAGAVSTSWTQSQSVAWATVGGVRGLV
jgi:hypothetical protein